MPRTKKRSPVVICTRCNQPHTTYHGYPACTAHRTHRDQNGDLIPCTQPRCRGLTVCHMHGGSSRAARAQRARVNVALAAGRATQIFGLPRQVDPAQGLIEEYWRTAGLVAAYERVVSGVALDDLVWGVVERATIARSPQPPAVAEPEPRSGPGEGSGQPDGPDPATATTEARTVAKGTVNVWVQMFNAERDRFAKLGVEIVKLGLEARRDEYIRAQVDVFASVLLSPELALTGQQRQVAARLLRGLGAVDTSVVEGVAVRSATVAT